VKPFLRVEGPVAPLDRVDVDTDQIIPKQFLKRVERTGYGSFLFHDWRFDEDGIPDPDFVLNRSPYREAPILVAGRNFGCGSSREHAAWALVDFGIRAVVAPSFADIFRTNAYQNGLLPVVLPEEDVRRLLDAAREEPGYRMAVDLEALIVQGQDGFRASFEVDPFRRRCLLEGMDDIDLTLLHEERIQAYEEEPSLQGRPGSGPNRINTVSMPPSARGVRK
jgi:3-isopropylmalate/(R)-2-methylmalate dehydratase small subunit